MTPKEKAEELYAKMLQWQVDAWIYIQRNITSPSAKKCALIAVDEILGLLPLANRDFWQQVKNEIEKL